MASGSGQPRGNAPPAASENRQTIAQIMNPPPAAPGNNLTVAEIMNMTPPLQPGEAPWPLHEIVRYRNWYLQRDHPEHPRIGLTVEEIMTMTPPQQPGEPLWSPYELARWRNWYLQRDHPNEPLINTTRFPINDNPRPVPPPWNPNAPPYHAPNLQQQPQQPQRRQLPQPLQNAPYQSPYAPPPGGWFQPTEPYQTPSPPPPGNWF